MATGVHLSTDFGEALNADGRGVLRDAARARLDDAAADARATLARGVRPDERPLLDSRLAAMERARAIVSAAWSAAHE